MLRTKCTNQVILTGFVGEKVDHRKVKGDISKATFFLGLPYEEGDRTEWETHAVESWRGLADLCKSKLTKGSKVLVQGQLRLSRWTDANEQPQSRQYIEAERVEFISLKPKSDSTDSE